MKLRTHTFSSPGVSKILTFAAIGVLFGFLFAANFSRTKIAGAFAKDSENNSSKTMHFVTFHENGSTLTIKTNAKTVEEAISRAKIELDGSDRTEPERLEEINIEGGKNFDIYIYRARPVIMIDGASKKYLMTATYDTKSLAAQAGFTIYKGDKIKMKTQENILETGLVETYEIIHGDSSETEIGKKELLSVSREKILGIEKVKEKTPEKIPEFVTNPDRATCEAWMRAAGISESDMDVAYTLIWHESKCRYNARNKSSGAYGIPQSLPGNKMAEVGSDWETNPITQIKWMIKYVKGRYGSWQNAWSFWGCRGKCGNVKNKTSNWY
jgi:hypothetical protein